MDQYTQGPEPAPYDAFAFHGRWQEFAPIVFTNLLLTIVTLGIYRFWAKARERRYLWSRTQFVDDRLEWTGTGKEMFLGFLIVMAVLLPVGIFVQFGVPALFARGYGLLAGLLVFAIYGGFFYLIGVAMFRALRYRLSRTRWHGLRGGSEQGGWAYGGTAILMSIITGLTGGIAYPWAQVRLWRDRWGAMTYGDAWVGTDNGSMPKGLFARWLLIYVGAAVLFIGFAVGFGAISLAGGNQETVILIGIAFFAGFYLGVPLLFVTYYAKFMREMIGEMGWMDVDFSFNARTLDWIKLYLGHALLVVVTLGVGILFIGYRNWSFFVRHLEARGEIDPDRIAQSDLTMRTDAEGLADAFDIGAI